MEKALDSVQAAAELGRLDFVSALLACIAILFAVGAFPLWHFVMRRAESVAEKEVQERLKGAEDRIEAEAISRMEAMLPQLVKDYVELSRGGEVSDDAANRIAEAQENDGTG